MRNHIVLLTGVFLAAMLVAGRPAHAYLDPGTGSMLLQLAIGGVAGLLLVVKLYFHSLKTALKKRFAARKRFTTRKPS